MTTLNTKTNTLISTTCKVNTTHTVNFTRCHTKECIRCKEFPLNCRCCENDESDETSYDGRCHYDDHNGDRHGNDGIGNGYGRNGFGAPKISEQ
jgi:hypothetical protein